VQQVQTTLPSGSVVGERYQIEKLLGKGGFGAVYLVQDLRVRQNVFALKEIYDPDQRERRHFTFEADLLKRADHPSLPRVYRAFDEPAQGRAYLLMDYIEGPNLENLRRRQPGKRFSLPEVLTLIGPIVEAIVYLHTQQPPIVHRDIKPSNIIAPVSGARTMLVDFGIAKEFDKEATTTVIRHATPGYGAPEQYGTGTDPHTDVYGLGATIYTLLTGVVPIDAFYRMAQQMGKQIDPLPPVKQLIPDIPEHVSAAITRALALEKNERFASIEDFWQDLQPGVQATFDAPLANRTGPAAHLNNARQIYLPDPEIAPQQPSRLRGRWWMAMALLLLLALGIGFAAALFTLRGQQAHTPAATPGATVTHIARATAIPTPTPSPQPTLAPTATTQPTAPPTASVPTLSNAYSGTLHDANGNTTSTMSLQGVKQNGQAIQGNFSIALPLIGNGPFTGTLNASSAIQFTVHSPDVSAPLFFSGQVQPDGTLSGQYCSLDTGGHCNTAMGGYGTWSVRPGNSGS
jgi:serine/threonine protein kinase